MASRRVRNPKAFGEAAMAACVRLLDRKAVGVDWPASRSRRSVRVRFDDGAVIATLRKDPRRSRLEYEVLRALHENGAPVPEPLAYDGQWLIQENLEGVRLAHALTEADDGQAHDPNAPRGTYLNLVV